MFQLTLDEAQRSRSQSVTLDAQPPSLAEDLVPRMPRSRRGANIKYLPYAFTEQGVAMLSSVLRSPRAVQVNIEIVRAFVRLRQIVLENTELARKLARSGTPARREVAYLQRTTGRPGQLRRGRHVVSSSPLIGWGPGRSSRRFRAAKLPDKPAQSNVIPNTGDFPGRFGYCP